MRIVDLFDGLLAFNNINYAVLVRPPSSQMVSSTPTSKGVAPAPNTLKRPQTQPAGVGVDAAALC